MKNVPLIASVLCPIIVKLDSELNKETLTMSIVESCDFVERLEDSMTIMPHTVFKYVQQYLIKSGVQLFRPPGVKIGVKLSKCEAKSKQQVL